MPKFLLLLICLTVILTAAFVVYRTQDTDTYKPGLWHEADAAVNQAKHFYRLTRETGEDLSHGPCLNDFLMSNWVVDIVHSPRTKEDDLPENQCPSYNSGKFKHFVEMDAEGNILRVK